MLPWRGDIVGVICRGPMRQVLLPRMLQRVLDRLMDLVERELVQIPSAIVAGWAGLRCGDLRRGVQHVLIEAIVAGRTGLRHGDLPLSIQREIVERGLQGLSGQRKAGRVPIVLFVVAGMPMPDLVLVVQMQGIAVAMMRPILAVPVVIVAIVLVPRPMVVAVIPSPTIKVAVIAVVVIVGTAILAVRTQRT